MRRLRSVVCVAWAVVGCGPATPTPETQATPSEEQAPPVPRRLTEVKLLKADGLDLDLRHYAIGPWGSEESIAELAQMLRTYRWDDTPHIPLYWNIDVRPDATAGALTQLVLASRDAGMELSFGNIGISDVSPRVRPPPPPGRTLKCKEVGVAIGRGMTWVGLFEMEISKEGARLAAADPSRVARVHPDSTDPAVCRRLGGRPQHLDLARLTGAVAAVQPLAGSCGTVRVALHGSLEWRHIVGALEALEKATGGFVLVAPDGELFRGCGGAAFEPNDPAFWLAPYELSGPLEAAAIRQVFHNHGDESDVCMGLEEPTAPGNGRRLHPVEVTLGERGEVVRAELRDPTDAVARCLVNAVKSWKFPEPRAAAPVAFTLGYEFEAGAAGP